MNNEKYFLKNSHYMFNTFEFKNGDVLENVVVDYGVMGTPKYDDEGYITNAVIFCHGFRGNYASIHDFNKLTESGHSLSREDYFFISITSLGFPNSCSPSSTNLKYKFPKYSIEDAVNFKRNFIFDKFKIKKIKGIFGYSFGGYEALAWSILYPDDMEFIIHFISGFKTSGFKYISIKFANSLIESNQDYYSDVYEESLSTMLILLSKLQYLISSHDSFEEMSKEEINFLMGGMADDWLFYDVYDIKYRSDMIIDLDLEDDLHKIKTNLLIISIKNIIYYNPKFDAIPLHDAVEDSKLILCDNDYTEDSLDFIQDIDSDVQKFLDSI